MTNAEGQFGRTRPSLLPQYETLRAAALGNALPPEARAGLMLFLQAGHVGMGAGGDRHPYVRAASRLATIELEGAGGTQNRNSSLCSHGDPNRYFTEQPHE